VGEKILFDTFDDAFTEKFISVFESFVRREFKFVKFNSNFKIKFLKAIFDILFDIVEKSQCAIIFDFWAKS